MPGATGRHGHCHHHHHKTTTATTHLHHHHLTSSTIPLQADFCPKGIEGYFTFVQGVVEFLRSASTAIGCSLGGIIIVELIVIFNIARLRTKIIDENKNAKNGEKRTTAEMTYA